MSIFYENFLRKITTQYFEEEEINSADIKVQTLTSLNNDTLTLDKIPEKIIYTQKNPSYCVIRIGKFVYSFSFMTSSKIHQSMKDSLSLTFGLIKSPRRVTVGEIKNLDKMSSYRDSSTRTNVGTSVAKILWKNIITYFKSEPTFMQKKMSYRADLEAHEHAILSNLIGFLKMNEIDKETVLSKIREIRIKTENASTHADISSDSGKTDYYAFSGDLHTPVEKTKIINLLKAIEKLIIKHPNATITKEELSKIMSRFESKNLIRTGLYTFMTKEIFGYRKVKKNISKINETTIDNYLEKIKENIKKDAVVTVNGDTKSIVTEKEINELIEKIRTIVNGKSQNKIAEIEETVDDFYINIIQDFDYLKNRYVLLKM